MPSSALSYRDNSEPTSLPDRKSSLQCPLIKSLLAANFQELLQLLNPHGWSSFLALGPPSQGPLQPGCPFPNLDPPAVQSCPYYICKCHYLHHFLSSHLPLPNVSLPLLSNSGCSLPLACSASYFQWRGMENPDCHTLTPFMICDSPELLSREQES